MTTDELRTANDIAHRAAIEARLAFLRELSSRTSTSESRRAARLACEAAGAASLAAANAYAYASA